MSRGIQWIIGFEGRFPRARRAGRTEPMLRTICNFRQSGGMAAAKAVEAADREGRQAPNRLERNPTRAARRGCATRR
jgi:hypothetical protein